MIEVVMPSHARRDAIRAETVGMYRRLGLAPRWTRQTTEPSQPRMRVNAGRALSLAEGDGPVLFVEDDTTPGETLPAWLEYLTPSVSTGFEIVLLFAIPRFVPMQERSLERRRENLGEGPGPSRVVEIEKAESFTCSQAVLFSRPMVDAILETPTMHEERTARNPFDWTLRAIAQSVGARWRCTIPSVVEHDSPASVISRKRQNPLRAWRFDPQAAPPGAHTLE